MLLELYRLYLKIPISITILGQRLVFYLAVADLLFSIIHFIDHLYAVLEISFEFENFCVTAAFFLNVSLNQVDFEIDLFNKLY